MDYLSLNVCGLWQSPIFHPRTPTSHGVYHLKLDPWVLDRNTTLLCFYYHSKLSRELYESHFEYFVMSMRVIWWQVPKQDLGRLARKVLRVPRPPKGPLKPKNSRRRKNQNKTDLSSQSNQGLGARHSAEDWGSLNPGRLEAILFWHCESWYPNYPGLSYTAEE